MRKLATEMDKIHTLQQVEDISLTEGGTGGYRSCFTENKLGLSQFMKNNNIGISHFTKKKKNVWKITVYHSLRLLWKSPFTREKIAISHFTGTKGRSQVMKIPSLQLTCKPLYSLLTNQQYLAPQKNLLHKSISLTRS